MWRPSNTPRLQLRSGVATLITGLALSAGGITLADQDFYPLPQIDPMADTALQQILRQRRTCRAFAARPISLAQIGQLLWAAQGVTSALGQRTAPSAGALYPLELHLVAGQIEGLPVARYRYDPHRHALRVEKAGDLRRSIAAAALHQEWLAGAAAIVVVSAVEARTTAKYGQRGIRYVHMEVGHASQNLLLQAEALGLGAAIVGAYDDAGLHQLLGLPGDEQPLAILPLGHRR